MIERNEGEVTIDIRRDFSRWPGGRTPLDGSFSGEKFRKKHLIRPLKKGKTVRVIFDDEYGYGSSFLEEAFGGLIRNHGFEASAVLDKLIIEANDKAIVFAIESYVRDAESH